MKPEKLTVEVDADLSRLNASLDMLEARLRAASWRFWLAAYAPELGVYALCLLALALVVLG